MFEVTMCRQMHLWHPPKGLCWYILRFLYLSLIFVWAISTWTNHSWAHPFCYFFTLSRCLSMLCMSLRTNWSNTLTTSRGYFHTYSFSERQKEHCRYGRGWVSLCVCGGQPCHPRSSAPQAKQGATPCRGSTDPAVPTGELGVVRHDHRGLFHLPTLPKWICEYQPQLLSLHQFTISFTMSSCDFLSTSLINLFCFVIFSFEIPFYSHFPPKSLINFNNLFSLSVFLFFLSAVFSYLNPSTLNPKLLCFSW